MIPDLTDALHGLADRHFGKTPTSPPKLAIVGEEPESKLPSRHDALVKYGVLSRENGLSGAALLAALNAKNSTYDEPKPDDEVRALARWCDREVDTNVVPLLSVVDATALLERPYKPPSFLAKFLIPEKSLVLLSGDTGGGKTAFLFHACLSIITGTPVAGQFDVRPGTVILYVNGEMSDDTLTRYLQEAAAGLKTSTPANRLFFEGGDGIATWRFGESPTALAALVEKLRPDLVILDTQRALLVEDESDTSEVRRVFAWIRTNIVNAFGTSVIIAHHLRKIGPISNSSRERVAGSRDIIGSVDVHLAAMARDGNPLHALRLDKTRMPFDGVGQGTEWPIEARLEPGSPNRSTFLAGEPTSAAKDASAEDAAVDEIRARLSAENGLTIDDLNAKSGTRRRAWDRLRKTGEIREIGKLKRKSLYALATEKLVMSLDAEDFA
jgi:hypothetical protein